MAAIAHRFVTTNGIKMHYAEAGSASACCCATAFPNPGTRGGIKCTRSPRGVHAIAPDMRGYGQVDRNWALTPFLDGAKLRQPTLFIAGDRDGVLGFWGEEVAALERNVPNLRKKLILPGVGHWTQQESPDAVNRALIEFLRGV